MAGTDALRVLHPRHGTHAATTSTPDLKDGTIRHTSTVDMLRPDGATGRLVLVGRARDVWSVGGVVETLDEAWVDAEVDFMGSRALSRISTSPTHLGTPHLLGRRVSGGFRGAVDEFHRVQRDACSPLYLLDDLPVATLTSGYSVPEAGALTDTPRSRFEVRPLCARGGPPRPRSWSRRRDRAAGWSPVRPRPAVRTAGTKWAGSRHAMRRARRTDLRRDGDVLVIDSFYREHNAARTVSRR